MAKKFGKVLLLTAVAASAAAAVYYYMQKKDAAAPVEEDEDLDDFDEDLDVDSAFCPNYVPLTPDSEKACESCSSCEESCNTEEDDDFTPLSEQIIEVDEMANDSVAESVEEFFDEDENN